MNLHMCILSFSYFIMKKRHNHLLQLDFLKSYPSMQTPFHLEGISPIPSSLKLGDSGHIPKAKNTCNILKIFWSLTICPWIRLYCSKTQQKALYKMMGNKLFHVNRKLLIILITCTEIQFKCSNYTWKNLYPFIMPFQFIERLTGFCSLPSFKINTHPQKDLNSKPAPHKGARHEVSF